MDSNQAIGNAFMSGAMYAVAAVCDKQKASPARRKLLADFVMARLQKDAKTAQAQQAARAAQGAAAQAGQRDLPGAAGQEGGGNGQV